MFQNEEEAKQTLELLKERLATFSLEVAEEKTRILPFGPRTGTNEDFDFLGFTIFNAKTKYGKFRTGIRTCMKKLKAKMQIVNQWIKSKMHEGIEEVLKQLNQKFRGHCQYYGVNGNFKMLANFRTYRMSRMFSTLRRRGQNGKISWNRFIELWEAHIDKPKIMVNIWY